MHADFPHTLPVFEVGEAVEYLSSTYGRWIETEIEEVLHSGPKVKLKLRCKVTARLTDGKVRKLERQASDSQPAPSPTAASSTGSHRRLSKASSQTLGPGEFLLDKASEESHREKLKDPSHREKLKEIKLPCDRIELARDRNLEAATRGHSASGRKSSSFAAASRPGGGLALAAGKEEKKRRELERRKSDEEKERRERRKSGEGHSKATQSRSHPTPPMTPLASPMRSRMGHNMHAKHKQSAVSGKHPKVHAGHLKREGVSRRERSRREKAGESKKEGPCEKIVPYVGDEVMDKAGGMLEDEGWVLNKGEIGVVTKLDADQDFKLRNPSGIESSRFLERKYFCYASQEAIDRSLENDLFAPDIEEAPKRRSTAMSSTAKPPEKGQAKLPEVAEHAAKKAKVQAKSQVKPKNPPAPAPAGRPAPAPARQAVPAPAPAAAAVPAGPAHLDKQGKQELQNKIDRLEEDFLDTVLRFLELGGDEDEEINLDLDNLSAQRQQQLVKVVDEELAKQQARQDAKARGERTPPDSPIFDIGRDILTPLQSHQSTPMEHVAMSPLQLEAASVKNEPPFATPFPTPSPDNCDEHTEVTTLTATQLETVTPQRHRAAGSPAQPASASGVVGRAVQSVGKLMEDTISRAVRKAVKATPELTESKTPRQQGPTSSPKHSAGSPRTRPPDSMLDLLDEDDLLALTEEVDGGSKAADEAAEVPRRGEKDNAASATSA